MKTLLFLSLSALSVFICGSSLVAGEPEVTFNTNFEGGSLGRVEAVGPNHYRCAVAGQQDQRGRNRQANWYFFRIDHARGRDLTLTLHDFVGEYNDKPGAVAMTADTVPVFSDDGEAWRHFPAMDWDAKTKEATLHVRPAGDSLWVAHIQPYAPRHLARLLTDVERSPHVFVEVIGKSAGGRDLHEVTVTDPATPEVGKKTVWLMARQHAWEAGTSYVMDGALRFAASDDEQARRLRERVVMKFSPMVDPDGCAAGRVRFNANGYDVNRHWADTGLSAKESLRLMPEIWYAKKTVLAYMARRPIDLMVNMHNTETNEYLETQADDPATLGRLRAFHEALRAGSSFDPATPELRVGASPSNTSNALWREGRVPIVLMEQRISTSKKLGRRPTVEDRRAFGKDLIATMAETVLR
ncbi:MAG: M14-type cytosolic carboxypeptidase [Gemmataceae bacterium]